MVYTLNNLPLFQLCQFTCLRFLTAREKRVLQCIHSRMPSRSDTLDDIAAKATNPQAAA
jgi:hypothetical protein